MTLESEQGQFTHLHSFIKIKRRFAYFIYEPGCRRQVAGDLVHGRCNKRAITFYGISGLRRVYNNQMLVFQEVCFLHISRVRNKE